MTGEEIILPQQHRIIQEAKLSYSAQIKAYKTKTNDEHDEKQVNVLQFLDLNSQQIQLYLTRTKPIEDKFLKY